MSAAKPPFSVVLLAHLRADPRKTTVLVLLTVVLLVLGVRWYWGASGPETAEAGPPTDVVSVQAVAVPAAPTSMPSVAPRVPVIRQVARDLQNDPFALDLQKFPPGREEPKTTGAPGAVIEDPIEAAARTLVLQSTLCGPAPLACINGEFIRIGQRVNGFVLEQVGPTKVVLGREGVKVELFLK